MHASNGTMSEWWACLEAAGSSKIVANVLDSTNNCNMTAASTTHGLVTSTQAFIAQKLW